MRAPGLRLLLLAVCVAQVGCLPFVTPPVRAGVTFMPWPTSYAEAEAGVHGDTVLPSRHPYDAGGGFVYALKGKPGLADETVGRGAFLELARSARCDGGLPLRLSARGTLLRGRANEPLGYGGGLRATWTTCDEKRLHGVFATDDKVDENVWGHARGVGSGAFDLGLHAQAGFTRAPDGSNLVYLGIGGTFELAAVAGFAWLWFD